MSEQTKKRLIDYGVTMGVCLLFAAVYLYGQDWESLDMRNIMRICGDAFTVPGMLCVFAGALTWLGREGAMDGLGYVASHAWHLLVPGSMYKRETYGEYVERKRGKKQDSFGHLLVCGLICIGISLVFLVLHSMY